MSDYGGCLVCGQVLGKEDGVSDAPPLLCHDCRANDYMKQTGSKAGLIKITDDGPVEVQLKVEYVEVKNA